MKIITIDEEPILEVPFLNAGKGRQSFYIERLPVVTAQASEVPEGLDAVIATADLQGRERLEERPGQPPRLLGEVLPHQLAAEILPELGIRAERSGAILAGDFYTVPALDKRGGSGDVTAVWRAFGDEFEWVAGVAGNHDTFGMEPAPTRSLGRQIHYLDGDSTEVHGLAISGLGGIIGNPKRPHRRLEDEYLFALELLLEGEPDLLITHDGPDDPAGRCQGSAAVRELLESYPPTLVVRGHSHWKQPLAELAGGTQVLNVDCRVVIMTPVKG